MINLHIIALMRNYSQTSGGVQKHGRELYLHLAEKGIAVTILANRKQCEQKTPYNDGPLQVVPVPFPDVFFRRWGRKFFLFHIQKRKLVKLIQPYVQAHSVLHAHWIQEGLLAGFYGRELAIPVYFSCHGMYAARHLVRFTRDSAYWNHYLREESLGLKGLNTMSDSMTVFLINNLPSNLLAIKTIHNAINPDNYAHIPNGQLTASVMRFSYIGRLVRYKHVDMLITALKQFTNETHIPVQLDIAGEGPELDNLKQLCQALAFTGNVIFHGYVKAINTFLSQSQFYLSASSVEGLPNAPLEAMASGVIPILSDIGPHREIVQHGQDGFLFEENSVESLVQVLKTLKDFNLKDLQERALHTVRTQFTTEEKTRKYIEFLTV